MLEWLVLTEGQPEAGVSLTGEHLCLTAGHCTAVFSPGRPGLDWVLGSPHSVWSEWAGARERETAPVLARDDPTDGDTRPGIIGPQLSSRYLPPRYTNFYKLLELDFHSLPPWTNYLNSCQQSPIFHLKSDGDLMVVTKLCSQEGRKE